MLFRLGQHYSPSSSSGASKLVRSSLLLSPQVHFLMMTSWSPFSSVLLVHLYGQFTLMCPSSSKSLQDRVSFSPSPLSFPLLPLDPLSLSPYQDLPPWCLSCLLYFLHRLFCHSSIHQLLFHDTAFPLRLELSCPFHAIAHTSSLSVLGS